MFRFFNNVFYSPSPFPISLPLDLTCSIFQIFFPATLSYFSLGFDFSPQWFSNFNMHQHHLEGRLKQTTGPHPQFLIGGLGLAWEFASFQIISFLKMDSDISFKYFFQSFTAYILLNFKSNLKVVYGQEWRLKSNCLGSNPTTTTY